ncbi:MAG: hypothetical protein HKP37_05825 [Boseongicola sp.]|nr:hypothetical protein [Boseongicola sp.]
MAQAQDLILPQVGTDPVILRVLNGTPHPEMLEVTLRGAETPIAGRYAVVGDLIHFTPAFGFDAGRDYVVRLPNDNEAVPFRLSTDMAQIAPAVTDIYPSGDTLPENTLRFYIHFSVPMQSHVAFDYIKLRDASGAADDAAFMRFKQELWNEDRTRLTVLIDPGRIKREVATNLELGPAVISGQQYTLAVNGGWPSADGTSILPAFSRTFQVSGALRIRPDTDLWTANTPCAGTRDPMTVTFDRPFDRHLLTQALRLETEAGGGIKGKITVADAETALSFTPLEPWPTEELVLIANPTLEDVAGNNFRDLLDHTTSQQETDLSTSQLKIRFQNCAD